MRIWIASFELGLEPIFGSKIVRWAFVAAFYVVAKLRVDEALKIPGVSSDDIFRAIAIGFLWTLAGAVALSAIYAVPATIWTRLSIARSNRVKSR